MALIDAATVEQDGGLTYQLFNLPGQVQLDALVNTKITLADAWLQTRAGAFYNSSDPNIQILLKQAESYLTLHYITPILRALKTYGTHFPYMSEESPAYDQLLQQDWREEAESLLGQFLTQEDMGGKGFARPLLLVTSPVDPSVVEPRELQYEDELEEARGISEVPFATVNR